MTLSEKFENYEVCHATGIELDIVSACHDFCLAHIASFDQTEVYEIAIGFLGADEPDINQEDLAYFTHEVLQDYMGTHSPIGCYFGSHKGDGTLGYWRILEYSQVGYDYTDSKPLPYKQSGYVLFGANECIGDKLASIDSFLEERYYDEYLCSDLQDAISELTGTDPDSTFETVKFCEKIIEAVVTELLPMIAPDGLTWRLDDDNDYGLFPELPALSGYTGNEVYQVVEEASLYSKLVYINENKASSQLGLCNNVEYVDNLVVKIMSEPHYVALGPLTDKTPDREDMAQYIADNDNVLRWVIENVYWSDYKAQIDRLVGSQDITRLFLDVLGHGNGQIDGISEEVYSLRESCVECEHLDLDYDEYDSLDCGCCSYGDLNNVWIVTGASFYEALEASGAMVYETDSLYLYFQTDFSGNYYDSHLRRAWVLYGYMAFMGKLL